MAARSSLNSIMRKKLSDVTNLPTAKPTGQDEKLPEIYLGDKDRIEQLMGVQSHLGPLQLSLILCILVKFS